MKIIFVTREGYHLPGARIRCYNFAKELGKYGLQAEVLSFSDTLGAKDGKKEQEMNVLEKIKYNLVALKRLLKLKASILYLQRVHYHSFAPYLTHIITHNKLILDMDDWEMRENPIYRWGIYPTSKAEYLMRKIAKRSDICIAASKFLEETLSKYNRRVYYIPSAVDTNVFKFTENNQNDGKIIFSWIGTLHRKDDIENVKFILDCFSCLREKYLHLFLEIVGDGIYMEDLKRLLNTSKYKAVVLKGWIQPEAMPDYLSSIDVGLLPLVQDTKFNKAKSPVKLFEYMAMGKPTISSKIGEAVHIIKDGENGLLASDKGEFIDKMEVLINSKEMRINLGNKAVNTVYKNYSLSLLGEKIFKILKEMI